MPGLKPDGRPAPEFSVVEDSPRRLVLATGAARQVIGAILLALGLLLGAGAGLIRDGLFLLVPAALFAAGGIFFLLARQRWTFDAARGTVAFDSVLWGAWEARMGSVTGLEITSTSHGPAGDRAAVQALMMTVEGRPKAVRVNASIDPGLVREQKRSIEAMLEPWRPGGGRSGMLS